MKKGKKALYWTIGAAVLLIAVFVCYYVTLPAINIHSEGFWFFLMGLIIAGALLHMLRQTVKIQKAYGKNAQVNWKDFKLVKALGILFLVILAVYLIGSILSSPIVNAKKYQALLTVEERNFTDDIKEVDYSTIPLLDRDSAAILGDRKMGSMVEMVSQFEVANDYTQINYQGKPVRVTPLVYASPIKWLTNQKNGIPAYMKIDMTTQDTEIVMLEEGIKYSKSEYFNRNIYRHLRFKFPTYIFDDQIFLRSTRRGRPSGYAL